MRLKGSRYSNTKWVVAKHRVRYGRSAMHFLIMGTLLNSKMLNWVKLCFLSVNVLC